MIARGVLLFALLLGLHHGLSAAGAMQEPVPQGELTDRIVNDPRPETFRPYGFPTPPRVVRDRSVQFGKALRLPIKRAEAEDWQLGLTIPVLRPIAAGDRIVVAFWARARGTEGAAPGRIARVQVEQSSPPHRALFAEPVTIDPEWRMYRVAGVADADYAPQQLQVAMHLATGRQVVELGPAFVLRYAR